MSPRWLLPLCVALDFVFAAANLYLFTADTSRWWNLAATFIAIGAGVYGAQTVARR